MSFVNWSLSFSQSFTGSLVEALLKTASVLTYSALSTVVLLIKARTVIDAAAALLWRRHSGVEVAEGSNPTLNSFARLSRPLLLLIQPQQTPAHTMKGVGAGFAHALCPQEHISPLAPFSASGLSPITPLVLLMSG